jgi:hypothetical protein
MICYLLKVSCSHLPPLLYKAHIPSFSSYPPPFNYILVQLYIVAVRFYIPPDPDQDPTDKSIPYPAELLQQRIMQTASIRKTTGDILVEFEQSKGTFLTPRGRYAIELYDWFLRLRGQKYDYKVRTYKCILVVLCCRKKKAYLF